MNVCVPSSRETTGGELQLNHEDYGCVKCRASGGEHSALAPRCWVGCMSTRHLKVRDNWLLHF